MKIYFIDKTGKNLKIEKLLEKKGIENIEHKDTYSFRSTKNDFVILSEYNENEDNSLLKKVSNLIIITKNKDFETVWKLSTEYKTVDIILESCGQEYIADRIFKLVSQCK